MQARRQISQNRPSRARETICFQTRHLCLLCRVLLWAARSGLRGLLWAACLGLLGLLWAAMSKFIVVPLRQNACKFWRLENTHPDLPPNWCSGAGEMPDFPKPAFSCTQNHMFRNSVWLFALDCPALLWAILGCSGLLGLLWAAVSKFIVVPLRQNACSFWCMENTHPNLPAN